MCKIRLYKRKRVICFIVMLLCFLLVLSHIVSLSVAVLQGHVWFHEAIVEIGQNVGHHVSNRLRYHLSRAAETNIQFIASPNDLFDSIGETVPNNRIYLSFGNTSTCVNSVGAALFEHPEPESFIIRITTVNESSILACVDGLPLDLERHTNISFNKWSVNYGAVTGSYALLERLGFAFLHPLQPYAPAKLSLFLEEDKGKLNELMIHRRPHWPERGFHYHTQHPLELTEVLQGHDIPQFGPHGPQCLRFSRRKYNTTTAFKQIAQNFENKRGTAYCERWEGMVIDVDYFFEWAVANGLNKVEWLLLGNYKWGDELQLRQNRLRKLTHLGHQYSLMIGADVPIGNIQQHGWFMVNVRLPIKSQIKQIRERVDWIMDVGFDFMTTESGLSEFTHPECDLMLELMNAFAIHVNVTWGREAAIKVHCSTGQHCENYFDPRTGDPLNFNFLPTYAHSGMAVFPHTVQMYAFDDPTAGAYGNDNFSYVEDYLVYEAKLGKRSVMYYGETSYWVNVDIDVPLFLPIYGQRRLRDLHKIAERERHEHFRMDGQMNFDSGWEWGYWLSDVVTARASWDPYTRDDQLLEEITPQDEWDSFARSISVFSNIYGFRYGQRLNNILVSLTKLQSEVLIQGRTHGRPSPNIKKLSGIAYLSGSDTWSEIPRMLRLAMTQPNKVSMKETSDPDWPYVLELLLEMEKNFHSIVDVMDALYGEVNEAFMKQEVDGDDAAVGSDFLLNQQAMDYLYEIKDCVTLLWLRSKQVLLLYESAQAQVMQIEAISSGESTLRYRLLSEARDVLKLATGVMKRRENNYAVSWERVASWRENPTVYRFGLLWSVHSLYYWWRDQGLAEESPFRSPHSPCYLNRIDSTEVAVGWGKATLEFLRTFINRYTPFTSLYPLEIVNCLSSPAKEYEFPRDLHLLRPAG